MSDITAPDVPADIPDFDLDAATLQDIADAERLAGQSIGALSNPEKPKGKLLAALLYVHRRKYVRGYTFDAAMRVPSGEAFTALGLADDDEPADLEHGREDDADPTDAS